MRLHLHSSFILAVASTAAAFSIQKASFTSTLRGAFSSQHKHESKHSICNKLRISSSNPRLPFTQLKDLSEWRDLMFEAPKEVKNIEPEDYQEGAMREVCILPFPLDDTLLQGETKELCLYEDRFHQLFEKSISDHGGVVAMGILAPPAGILQTMPLCEIESFQKMKGDTGFGTSYSILATIRVVGRGSLIYIEDEEVGQEYLKGWCTELCDNTSSENGRDDDAKVLETGNKFADKMEEVFNSIVKLEEKLEGLENDNNEDDDDRNLSEASVRRRMLEAELDIFDDDEDDDEDDDDDDMDEEDDDSLRNRFERALKSAKSSDMQGYRISSSPVDPLTSKKLRSVQDLTALSWAYFACDLWSQEGSMEPLSFRLRAIEVVDLCERLKLALVMMIDHRSKLRETLKSRDSNEE